MAHIHPKSKSILTLFKSRIATRSLLLVVVQVIINSAARAALKPHRKAVKNGNI